MKNIMCLFFIFLGLQSNAQFLDSIALNITSGIVLSEYSLSQKGHSGSTYGAAIELPFGRFAFSAGIEMSNYGSHYNFNRKLPNSDFGNPSSFDVTGFDFKYLSFPIKVNVKFHKNMYFQVGIKPEQFKAYEVFELGELNDESYKDKVFHPLEEVTTKNITLETSAGFIYFHKGSNLRLFLEPTFGVMLKPIYTTGRAEKAQLMYGLKLGIKHIFNL